MGGPSKNSRFASPLSSPDFPPRTPRGDARTPGFLHLSFRDENDGIRDVIFIDAPGNGSINGQLILI